MPPCQAELEDHDIVTYSFGDQEAIYLRGQWTMHRNVHFISSIWRGCPHLGDQLQKELLLKVHTPPSPQPSPRPSPPVLGRSAMMPTQNTKIKITDLSSARCGHAQPS